VQLNPKRIGIIKLVYHNVEMLIVDFDFLWGMLEFGLHEPSMGSLCVTKF
jgi:hypothetical protein